MVHPAEAFVLISNEVAHAKKKKARMVRILEILKSVPLEDTTRSLSHHRIAAGSLLDLPAGPCVWQDVLRRVESACMSFLVR
jgi:hypothetical protein